MSARISPPSAIENSAELPDEVLMAQAPSNTQHPQMTIALAGNPNVGKSVFFNVYSGKYANVSNFPGTTVDVANARLADGKLIQDAPGVYGLSRMSEEETVAEETILAADMVINVVSALTLERDLFLTQQLIDYGKTLIVALNQMDEAESRHLKVDIQAIEKLLGVPVVPTVAIRGDGLEEVLKRLPEARTGNRTPDVAEPEALRNQERDVVERMTIYGLRRHYINGLVSRMVKKLDNPGQRHWTRAWSSAIGNALLNPIFGAISGIIALVALYQVVGVWVAGDLVGLTEETIMLGLVVPFLQKMVGTVIPQGVAYDILVGEFGVLTMSIQYIFGVLFPLVLGFYVYMSILEDSGYLPRIAVLLDGLLNRIGLNGRAIIPLILGLGCVTMATVSTRVLTSQRERTIASVLLAITVPCSAQLAVITSLMAIIGGWKAWMLYMLVLLGIMTALGTMLHKMLPGRSTSLILDLPPMRLPLVKNIAKKTWVRTKIFLMEASPLFMLGSLIVAIFHVTGLLDTVQLWLMPVTKNLLHLPAETAQAFIMGMVRRDFGGAGLYFLAPQLSPTQVLTSLVVITLFVPCIASAAVILKERGKFETALTIMGSWVMAFAFGAILTRLLEWIPLL